MRTFAVVVVALVLSQGMLAMGQDPIKAKLDAIVADMNAKLSGLNTQGTNTLNQINSDLKKAAGNAKAQMDAMSKADALAQAINSAAAKIQADIDKKAAAAAADPMLRSVKTMVNELKTAAKAKVVSTVAGVNQKVEQLKFDLWAKVAQPIRKVPQPTVRPVPLPGLAGYAA